MTPHALSATGMILLVAKYVVALFGVFLIGVGVLMLVRPARARAYL